MLAVVEVLVLTNLAVAQQAQVAAAQVRLGY